MDYNFLEYTPANLSKADEQNICEIGDSIYHLTSNRMKEAERKIVYKLLQRLKKYFKSISYEYIQYLLITSIKPHRLIIPLVGSNKLRLVVRPQMRKIKRILKEYGVLKVKSTKINRKQPKFFKGSLRFFNKQRFIHQISF